MLKRSAHEQQGEAAFAGERAGEVMRVGGGASAAARRRRRSLKSFAAPAREADR